MFETVSRRQFSSQQIIAGQDPQRTDAHLSVLGSCGKTKTKRSPMLTSQKVIDAIDPEVRCQRSEVRSFIRLHLRDPR
jgi:hypothetical protein